MALASRINADLRSAYCWQDEQNARFVIASQSQKRNLQSSKRQPALPMEARRQNLHCSAKASAPQRRRANLKRFAFPTSWKALAKTPSHRTGKHRSARMYAQVFVSVSHLSLNRRHLSITLIVVTSSATYNSARARFMLKSEENTICGLHPGTTMTFR
jgi:hypothetical protein